MFFIHVKRLVKTAGVESFTLQDLTRPEHARVCDCFSAVINFAKFKCVGTLHFAMSSRSARAA